MLPGAGVEFANPARTSTLVRRTPYRSDGNNPPTKRLAHPRDTLEAVMLWLGGALRPPGPRYDLARMVGLPWLACVCERLLRGAFSLAWRSCPAGS